MPFATAHTVSLQGALGHLIDVQSDVSPGQVGTTLVGRPDASLHEARERCRMAIVNSELTWPATKRITILLSPADLPKSGTHFDLAIAVSVLAADGRLPRSSLARTAFIGELTLDGGLRPVTGVLPMVMAAADRGIRAVFVPEPQAAEAAMVPDMSVIGVRSLAQVVAVLRDEEVPAAPPVVGASGSQLLSWRGEDRVEQVDMSDLIGMADARYALEVAAAGGHHVMLSGPKGSGKTSIAERLPTLLPDLTAEESLELTALHSLAGALDPGGGMIERPPFLAPHHDASKASIVGGGTGQVRPGAVSLAHAGVLFLDEFPLFRSDVIDALRQPLESGDVVIARADEQIRLPARGLVVLACNPCPCGDYTPIAATNRCGCKEVKRRDYRTKITGPVSDRVDILRHVEPLQPHEMRDRLARPEDSSTVRARVAVARTRQLERYDGLGWRLNAHVPGAVLRERWPLQPAGRDRLDAEIYDAKITSRGAVRVHRLAWSILDLRGATAHSDGPGVAEVETALALRRGEALPLRMLDRRAS